jgi:predicted DNA-binding transcriptional regulator AlpA
LHHSNLLTLADLAQLLGRSPEAIRQDLKRRPFSVPPRISVGGVLHLRWSEVDVRRWQRAYGVVLAQDEVQS